MSFMYKIAVMGDKDSICGFAALGMTTFPTEDTAEAEKIFSRLVNGGYGIIYITEKLAEKISDRIDENRFNPIPAVILIPGVNSNTGEGMAQVNKSVEKAVGSNILK